MSLNENFQIAFIIDNLPPSLKDFKKIALMCVVCYIT